MNPTEIPTTRVACCHDHRPYDHDDPRRSDDARLTCQVCGVTGYHVGLYDLPAAVAARGWRMANLQRSDER